MTLNVNCNKACMRACMQCLQGKSNQLLLHHLKLRSSFLIFYVFIYLINSLDDISGIYIYR